jgi:hypothetical protein
VRSRAAHPGRRADRDRRRHGALWTQFVLLVEDQVALPLNLQGLCECRYRGDELNMPAMMELLRASSPNPAQKAHGRDSAT